MLELAPGMSREDLSQWLRHGWFYARVGSDYKPCCLASVETRNRLIVQDTKGKRHAVRREDIAGHWPMCGAINYGPLVLYVQRHQQRVYRRTFQPQQVRVTMVRAWDSKKMFRQAAFNAPLDANDARLVESLFEPRYYSFAEARKEIEAGDAVARALTPHVVVTVAGEGKDGLLVYNRNILAGKIQDRQYRALSEGPGASRRIHKLFRGEVDVC